MLLPGRIYFARSPWYFGDYRSIFLPNMDEETKKILPSERGASSTVPYGKSSPGNCTTFIKRLDKGLIKQLLGQKPFALLGLYI